MCHSVPPRNVSFSLPQCHHMFSWPSWSALWLWRSVTDFWGWDAHEVRLRRPDDVSGDIWRWNAKGVLSLPKPKRTNYPDHGHHGDPPPLRKNSHGRTGNRTRDLMISSQRLWPLDHEAGPPEICNSRYSDMDIMAGILTDCTQHLPS
jgi:hypothetical protein